jgi:hypothetical protein
MIGLSGPRRIPVGYMVKIIEYTEPEYGYVVRAELKFATKADAEKYISQLQPKYEAIREYEMDV